MITNVSLAAKLRRLGGTPEIIRANLVKAGIKGNAGDCDSCAIAEFLNKTTKGIISAKVTNEGCEVLGKGFTTAKCATPQAAQEFIVAFDNNDYPELEAYSGYEFGPRKR